MVPLSQLKDLGSSEIDHMTPGRPADSVGGAVRDYPKVTRTISFPSALTAEGDMLPNYPLGRVIKRVS